MGDCIALSRAAQHNCTTAIIWVADTYEVRRHLE